jgi:hypothetical protein
MKPATGAIVQEKLPDLGAVQVNKPATGALQEMQRTTIGGDAGAVRAAGSPTGSSHRGAFRSIDEAVVPAMDDPWEKPAANLGYKGRGLASVEPLQPPMNKDGNKRAVDHLAPPCMSFGAADSDKEPEVRSALDYVVSIYMQ